MKLALTFEPRVKAQYKKICVQRIQQTVTQIKEHFKYQKNMVQIVQSNKTRTKLNQAQDDNIFCIDSSDKLHQSQQLISNFKRVQSNFAQQTIFYQNIVQKLKVMDQKQENLQKLVKQFRKLKQKTIFKDDKRSVQKMNLMNNPFSTDQSSITIATQVQTFTSPTFRANNVDLEKEARLLKNIINNHQQKSQTNIARSKQNFQLNNQIFDQTNTNLMKNSILHDNIRKNNYISSYKSQKNNFINVSQCHSNPSSIKSNKKTSSGNIFLSSNEINETAEFLVGFIKLEKQFNSIKNRKLSRKQNQEDFNLSKQKQKQTHIIIDNNQFLANAYHQQTVI